MFPSANVYIFIRVYNILSYFYTLTFNLSSILKYICGFSKIQVAI